MSERSVSSSSSQPPIAVEAGYDVVAIGGSAGGLSASAAILRSLPEDCLIPVVLMLHLHPESTLQEFFERLPFKAEWVRQGSTLGPRKLLLCPARTFVELLPDGSCVVSPCEGGALEKPINRLFDSVARSFGPRALGVILTGMGNDGALGARELHLVGGRVLVQSLATAEHHDMPAAAIATGATNLVVPLPDIGQVIGEICAGIPRPKARSEIQAIRRTFGNKGEVARLAHEMD